MELSDLVEGRSYAIRYGVDDEEHEFDGSVFVGLWYSDIMDESWPAFQRDESAPIPLLFNPDKIVIITSEK